MGTVAKKIMMGSGAVALPSDDEFNRTSFLSHFDGTNNGVNNQFTDGSTSNHTITANGNVTQGSFGPFARPDGEWGVALDGTASFLRATGAGDISGNFTLEAWVFMNSANGNYLHLTHNSGVINVVNIYNGSVQNFLFGTAAQPGQTTTEFNDTTWDAKVWTHLAIVRVSNTVKFYVNGVADATTVSLAGNLTDLEYIGTGRSFTSAGQVFDGKVSNVRFSSTARYTSNFTPSTTYFSSDSDTNLLTCQSNRFVDNSSNGHAITPSGSAAITAFGPFLPSSVYSAGINGASAYFDGTGDYLTAGDSTDYEFGTGDFTIEAWVYASSVDNPAIVSKFPNGARQFSLELSRDNNNHARYRALIYIGESGVFSNEYIAFNAWNHIAIVGTASDTTARIYTNGIRNSNTISYSGGVPAGGADPLRVGSRNSGGYFYYEGYICDLRLLKGTAAYSGASFTPPTAPLTAITNTKMLLNMADGQAIDSTAQHNLSLENGTNISTAQAKFGDSSIFFDGTTDTATVIGSENVNFGTDNFTVEGWIRPASFSGYKPNIISKWTNGSRGWAVRLVASGSGFKMRFTFSTDGSNDASLDATTVLAFDTWHHFAFVQNSNTVTCYANGTANGTKSVSTIFASTNPLILGDWDTNAGDYNGYMDDMRVTTGFARYTSNFTAPTKAFPDKGQ